MIFISMCLPFRTPNSWGSVSIRYVFDIDMSRHDPNQRINIFVFVFYYFNFGQVIDTHTHITRGGIVMGWGKRITPKGNMILRLSIFFLTFSFKWAFGPYCILSM